MRAADCFLPRLATEFRRLGRANAVLFTTRLSRHRTRPAGARANLANVTETMIVIPGHGAVGDKSQLAFYRDLLVGTREKVAVLKKQGKSLEEIVASKPTAATDAKWGNGFRSPKDFIGDVFQGV